MRGALEYSCCVCHCIGEVHLLLSPRRRRAKGNLRLKPSDGTEFAVACIRLVELPQREAASGAVFASAAACSLLTWLQDPGTSPENIATLAKATYTLHKYVSRFKYTWGGAR